MGESSISLIEQQTDPSRQLGTCTLNTLESIASELKGREVAFTRKEREKRLESMQKTAALAEKKYNKLEKPPETSHWFSKRVQQTVLDQKFNQQWGPAVARMDKIALTNFVRELQSSNSKIGRVLKKAEIKLETGNLEDAEKHIENGWKVGVILTIPVGNQKTVHMFHLGTNKKGNLVDLSDDGTTISKDTVERIIRDESINQEISQLQYQTGGWNLLLARTK